MFKPSNNERLAKAGALGGLSAVPISLGLTVSGTAAHIALIGSGLLLWVWALMLLLPREGPPN